MKGFARHDAIAALEDLIGVSIGWLWPLLERHIALAPQQAAADGGYASRENLRQTKAWGVRDMAFHKKGLASASRHRGRHLLPEAAYRLGRYTWRGTASGRNEEHV